MCENRTVYLYAQIDRKHNNGSAYIGIECLNSLEDSLLATTNSPKTMENENRKSQNARSQGALNGKKLLRMRQTNYCA